MKKFFCAFAFLTSLSAAVFAQNGTSLNISPSVTVAPTINASGNQVSPGTLNGSAVGSGNLNGNRANALNGNRLLGGNGALNGSLNGTAGLNNLNGSALQGTTASAQGNRLPVLNATQLQFRR